ncbi:hypothetical protein EDD11_010294 [Mortierella claussenii]|nr:hypothetical protein EDD11_010294 [Mortierella claussenii]
MISVKDQASAINSTRRVNAKESATHLIKDAKDEQREIQMEDRKAFYLLNCENCDYTLLGKPIKVSIENCKNVVLRVEDKIMTGTVDIWKSERVSLEFQRSVSTFQLDNISSITISLPDTEHFGSMVWAGVEDLTLRLGGDVHSLSYSELQSRNPALHPESDQFKTTVVDGSIMTEAIIRLDNGYPATRTEEANYRQLEKQKDQVLRAPLTEDE